MGGGNFEIGKGFSLACIYKCFFKMDYKLLADKSLVKLLSSSDTLAYKEIYTRYWRQVYLAALKKVDSKEIAEELAQDLFCSIWEKRGRNIIDNLGGYLNRAIRYQVIDYIRMKLTQDKYINHTRTRTSENLYPDGENSTIFKELSDAIHAAILKLPEKSREIFILSRFEHKSTKEIALIIGLTEKAVEYHITKCLKAMRLYLKVYLPILLLVVSGKYFFFFLG